MRYVIKRVRPSGELWIVRMSARGVGVWGGQERARIFLNRTVAETCLSKLRATRDGSMEIVALQEAVSGITIVPNDEPSEAGASQPDSAVQVTT
jgi:hypothetical protein